MQEKVNQFIALHDGKPCEVEDPSNADQCMDEAFAWCDFLGIPRETIRHEYAYQAFTNPTATTTEYFQIIPNTQEFVPQVGDVGVYGTVVGPAGHICLELGGGDTNHHESFDQNWNTANDHLTDAQGNKIPYCHKVDHNYNGFLGVLRPIQKPVFTEIPVTQTQEGNYYKGYNLADNDSMKAAVDIVVKAQQGELVDKTQFQTQQEATSQCQTQLKTANDQNISLQSELEKAQAKIKDITNQLADLKSKYDQETAKNIDLNEANKKISGENQDNMVKAVDAEALANNRKDFVNAIMDALDVKYDTTEERDLVEKCLEAVENLKKSQADSPLAQTVKDIVSHLNDQFGMNEYFKANNLPTIESLEDPQLATKVKQYLSSVLTEIQKHPEVAETVLKKNPSFLVRIFQSILDKLYQ